MKITQFEDAYMDKKLTENVQITAKAAGADLAGIADIDILKKLAPDARPESFLPGASSVVVAVVADPPAIATAPTAKEYMRMAYPGYQKADGAIYNVAAELRRKGFKTKFIVREWHTDKDNSGRNLKTIPLKESAQAAGLGCIGLHSLIVTPQYGPRVRMSGILTDAPLIAGKPLTKSFCNNCGACEKACPAGAIGKGEENSFTLCSSYLFAGLKLKELKSFGSDLDFNVIMQNGRRLSESAAAWASSFVKSRRLYYNCGKCVQVCNGHKTAKKKRPATVYQ